MISQIYSLTCSSEITLPLLVLDKPEIGLPPLFTMFCSSNNLVFESLFIL